MLKKTSRLKTKDINFLLKRRNMIFWKYFSFLYFEQYQNKNHNQISVQVWLKFHKSSVKRNFVRRNIYDYFLNNKITENKINNKFWKIFVTTNKETNNLLQKLVETKDKKHIKEEINNMIDTSFKILNSKIWGTFSKKPKTI